jgi:hypothetical protein
MFTCVRLLAYTYKKLWRLYDWAEPLHGKAWAFESKAVKYDVEERV